MYTIGKNPQQSRPALAKICKSLGIYVKAGTEDFWNEHKGMAYTYLFEGKYLVVINEKLSLEECRMALCHEVAHILLGHLLPSYVGSLEQQEFEAESLGYILYSYIYNRFYEAETISVRNSNKPHITHSFCAKVK